MVNVRREVSFAPAWDSTLTWYERAVGVMKSRASTDPTSWDYQAAIHGTATLPRLRSWKTCEHGGWYFFPWHRAYLLAFEQIVRAAVVAEGGPADWSLPYWNYENQGRDVLPPAFRSAQGPNGAATNHLHVADGDRFRGINQAMSLNEIVSKLGWQATHSLSSKAGMAEGSFSGVRGRRGFPFGFGGGVTGSSFQQDRPSDIEGQMHGNVHVLIGLGGGLMSNPLTAAWDPIFWLHHCNIDRLWAEWTAQEGRRNPTESSWLTQSWTFFRTTGQPWEITAADVNDVGALGYRYDPTPGAEPGIDAAGGPIMDGMPEERGPADVPHDPPAVGWSDSVVLSGHAASTVVVVDKAALDAASPPDGLDAGPTPRSYLELSDISAPSAPGILYGVYLHASADVDSPQELVGVISFFGLPTGQPSTDRHRHRLRYVLDATEALSRLGENVGRDRFAVSFRPLGPAQVAAADGLDAVEPDMPPVSVGRVALLME